MSNLAQLFEGANFRVTMKRFCDENGWRIEDLNDRRLVLHFEMPSGRTQILYVIKYDTTLEFSVPSCAAFSSEEEIPHILSTALLQRASKLRIGFWCIEKIRDKHVYSFMHNAEMQLVDADYFARVVRALLQECDRVEGILNDD